MSQHRDTHQRGRFGLPGAYECQTARPSSVATRTGPANPCPNYRASRYGGSRYDGDRRSRSPRDRSPYGDRTSQYGDGDRRRSSAESRNNTNAFQANRDSFRDSLTGREPPRGPKALIDPPSGPRGTNDFRGGRGGRGRGRGWRDDSRDRSDRGRDSDYRDRPHFREERSRERDWDRRDRDRDNFRGRRPLSPQGRGRASPPRDLFRDGPLNVDADRARRESRGDGPGPLSAGSSNSDPPFGPQSFRGGFPRGRGGRGRGDWDRGRGRGFYEDQDRYGPRSRSQEGRWGRDRDDRDRRDRYQDSARDIRDDRDPRSRDDRDLIRPKVDRVSHEPPSAKDVSPPPIAPSAPAFGSVPVPSRQSSTADIQSLTGKAPPTGPRAMGEERPVSSGGSERLPPTGPSKAAVPDASPSIPVGPRAQQQKPQPQPQQRSSNQWINPNIQSKKTPGSPKMGRSQSFVTQQPRPFASYRPESSHSDQTGAEFERRPRRSSDAQSDSHIGTADGQLRGFHMNEANDVAVRSERATPSARASVDREGRPATPAESKMDIDRDPLHKDHRSPSPARKAMHEHRDRDDEPEEGEALESPPPRDTEASEHIPDDAFVIDAPSAFLIVAEPEGPDPEEVAQAAVDEIMEEEEEDEEDDQGSSESEEDMDEYFEEQMAQVNTDLEKVEAGPEILPRRLFDMYERVKARASIRHALEEDSFETLVGSFPDDFEFPRPQLDGQANEADDAEQEEGAKQESHPAVASEVRENPTVSTTGESSEDTVSTPLDPQPKVEEMEMDGIGVPALPLAEPAKTGDGDVDMNDATQPQDTADPLPDAPPVNGVHGEKNSEFPSQFGQATSVRTSPEAMDEDSEDKTEDDASVYGSIEAVREFSATPPTEDLPIYRCKPWHENKRLRRSLEQDNQFGSFVIGQMRDQYEVKTADQRHAKEAYTKNYDFYLRFTISDDPTAVKSRNFFASSSVPIVTNGKPSAAPESKPEGRRGRYATELDLESVLQQSMREHEEKQEREARAEREKHRTDKEAVIPDMYWTPEEREHEFFYENAGLLPVEKLVATWQVLPPKINFTEEEAQKFETSYLQNPKQWGKIANEVPNRDFKSCIMYYYAKKKELNLKEKLKKQPRRRKKNKKQASSALISELKSTENETEENQENENSDKPRRPRRAAAPTFGYEATPAADSEGNTPSATPGRRRGAAANENKQEGEKTESKRGGRRARQPKADKEKAKPPIIAPQPPPGKPNRSRSNSRAQGPTEWTPAAAPPSSGPELGRLPTAFEVPSIGMQAPIMPVQQPPLASPERAPIQSTISEVMAPPSLRPEPPPPPPSSSVATFDIGAHDRNRTPMQASSYWSVAEVNDFPGLLRSFGTEWNKIAEYMQSKTPVMVKNYFVRQKDSAHPDWEVIATDADSKISRGEKMPAPPTPSAAPRKRYDGTSTTGQRTSAGRDVEPSPTPGAPFKTSFRVPIAQASPQGTAQSTPPPMPQTTPAVQQPAATQTIVPATSPANRPLRPPVAPFGGFAERDVEQAPPKPLAQATPISQQSASVPSPTQVPPQQAQQGQVPDAAGARAQWPAESSAQLSLHPPQKDNFRESRLSHKVREHALRPEVQPGKPNERVPLILKQEPDIHHYEPPTYSSASQPPQPRAPAARNEPVPIPRQAEPPRNVAPAAPPQQPAYHPPPAQALRMAFDHPRQPTPPQQPTASVDRPMPGVSRSTPIDPYGAVAPPPPPPSAPPAAAPAPAGPPRKSNLMALLNDDPPAPASTPAPPPKRVNDVSIGIKSASTPPPGPAVTRPPQPPPSAPPAQRREPEGPGYPYSRNPPSSIPPLKPFHTQSPQPTHINAPRSQMVSPIDPGANAQDREYYSRVAYQQHPSSANNPPPSHYPPQAQHAQAQQQAPMGYQQQQPYPAYPVSQPHSASPTPQYASHNTISGRRDPPPVTREPWQQAQPAGAPLQHQQQQAWPPPKQPQPVQSAWAAQHGGTPKQVTAPVPPPQQPQHSWAPSQPQQSHLSMRDDPHSRSSSLYGVHDTRSPGGMVQHQHHSSMSGRYQADPRRPEPGPPPAQPPYPRYSTPGPQQGRDPGPGPGPVPGRSYTPVGQYDPRGPPPGQYQDQLRDAQLRELASRDPREMAAREREAAAQAQAQAQHQAQQQAQHNLLPRHLRPHDGYDRVQERRY